MWSAIQVGVYFVCISFAARLVEIPYVDFVLALFFVPWVMYTAYGYAFTCSPLIPVCLLEDLFNLVDWLLPSSIVWPPELVTEIGCTSKECMRSCRYDNVIGFNTPEDHVAWLVCEADFSMGLDLAANLEWDFFATFRSSLARKCSLWDSTDSMRYAQRVCWGITAVNSTPILLVLMGATWLVPTLLSAVASLAQFAVGAVFALVLFVHSSAMGAD